MSREVFIVETVDQVDHILKYQSTDPSKVYIAVTPVIFVKLKESKYNVVSHREVLPKNYDLTLAKDRYKILQNIDVDFNQQCFFKTQTAKHSYKFFMNFLINYMVFLIMIIKYAKIKFNDHVICGIQTDKPVKVDGYFDFSNIPLTPFISSADSFCEELLNQSCELEGKRPTSLKSRKIESKIVDFINLLSIAIFKDEKIVATPTIDRKMPDYLNYIRNDSCKYLYIRMSNKKPYKEILYSLKNLFKHILKIKTKINGFEYDGIISVAGCFDVYEIKNITSNIFNYKEKFQYDQVEFYNAIKSKISSIVIFCNYLDNVFSTSTQALRYLDNSILVSHASNNFQELIGEVYAKFNKASFLMAHGTLIFPKNLYLYREYVEFDVNYFISETMYRYLVIQSPLTINGIYENNIDKNIIKSTPIMWGTEFYDFNRQNNNIKTILYADSSNERASIRPIHFTDIFEYIQTMIDLAVCVESIRNINLIVKIRESEDLTIDSTKYFLNNFKSVKIVSDKSFAYYLQQADILVSRSSTTIEEALMKNIPVLLYDVTALNKHIDISQDVLSSDLEISNFILYLTQKELLYCTITKMLECDYSTVDNKYTYNNKRLLNISQGHYD